MDLKNLINTVPDFPEKGVMFRDISPMLADPQALQFIALNLIKGLPIREIDAFAGIESRGFILGMLLAATHKKGFIPIRKAGKLPPPVIQQTYQLEYGHATLEMHQGKGRIVIVDDVLASGGTLGAAIEIAEIAGFEVVDVRVLVNLLFLNQFIFRGVRPHALVEYT